RGGARSWTLIGGAVDRDAGDALAVETVTHRARGEVDSLCAAAREDDGAAAGRVRAAVVEVHEELVARLVADDLEREAGEDAAGRRAVGAVVRRRLGGGVGRAGECRRALVAGAYKSRLRRVRAVCGRRRDGLRRRNDAVGAGLERQVEEADGAAVDVVYERRWV